MLNPFGKLQRYLTREYPSNGAYAQGVVVGAICGTGAAIVFGAPLMIPLVALSGVLSFAFVSPEEGRVRGNTADINGYQLIGEERAINSILMTQKLIHSLTEKKQHLQKLPADIEAKIRRHIEDIDEPLRHVRFVKDGEQVFYTEFCFERSYLAVDGKSITEKIPCIPRDCEEYLKVRQVAEGLPAPKGLKILPLGMKALPEPDAVLKLPAPVATEFTQIALKVEDIEGRLAAIENPKAFDLDKTVHRKGL